MKTKLLILLGLITLATTTGWCQQLQPYKYGLYDDYFVNPAYVGSKDYYSILVGYDEKFTGISVSPRTSFIGLHSRVGQGYLFAKNGKINKFFSKFGNMAFGFQGFMYDYGPQSEYNFGLTYGYHLDLSPGSKKLFPRKLVFAVTPRLFMINFNRNKIVDSDGIILDESFGDPIIPNDQTEGMFFMNFKFDVAALYQSEYYEVGLSWLNFTNARNGFESDSVRGGNSIYSMYDSIYSSMISLNGRIKCIRLSRSKDPKFDVNFIPDFNFIYKPNCKDFEIRADLRLDWNLYDVMNSTRKNLLYNIQGGTNIVYTRFYKDMVVIQPYISFDFLNFKVCYTYQFPVTQVPGYWGRNQISFMYALGRENRVTPGNSNNVFGKRR